MKGKILSTAVAVFRDERVLIKTKFHFMIDLLNLKLCFATDVLTERSGSLSELGSIFFFQSDLNLLKKFLYFTG